MSMHRDHHAQLGIKYLVIFTQILCKGKLKENDRGYVHDI